MLFEWIVLLLAVVAMGYTFDGGGGRPLKGVRRYRRGPSPLVRDSARSWRTGRLDRVLEGDFDLIT